MMNKLSDILVAILIGVLLSLLLSYPVMLLWNGCLVPAVTFAKEVEWIQMWGITLLISFLFNTRTK